MWPRLVGERDVHLTCGVRSAGTAALELRTVGLRAEIVSGNICAHPRDLYLMGDLDVDLCLLILKIA